MGVTGVVNRVSQPEKEKKTNDAVSRQSSPGPMRCRNMLGHRSFLGTPRGRKCRSGIGNDK